MKKKIFMLLAMLTVCIYLAGCNRTMFDTTYKFDEAIVYLPNGETVRGKVQSWTDFEDGDQLQVTIDGVTYLTHSTNIVLISK